VPRSLQWSSLGPIDLHSGLLRPPNQVIRHQYFQRRSASLHSQDRQSCSTRTFPSLLQRDSSAVVPPDAMILRVGSVCGSIFKWRVNFVASTGTAFIAARLIPPRILTGGRFSCVITKRGWRRRTQGARTMIPQTSRHFGKRRRLISSCCSES
jgi:hypothetical protein